MELQGFHGEIYLPGDAPWEDACTLFNAMVRRRPAMVARCSTADDVRAIVSYALASGIPLAVRGGGHSVTGACLVDDGIVVDTRGIRDLEVDPVRRMVRVGAGLTWGEVDRATQEYGLATTGGRVSTTGVVGLTLGGGSGWLERDFGLACDNLIEATLITSDGDHLTASAQQHPDLFWALHGGGGNFGVVTSMTFRLHPVGPEVVAGLLLHEVADAPKALRRLRSVMTTAPRELGAAFGWTTSANDDLDVPAHLRGRPIAYTAFCHHGDPCAAERDLIQLQESGVVAANLVGPVSYADFQRGLNDPPGYRNWWTADYLADLPDAAISTLSALAEQMRPGPSQLLLVPWGKAVAEYSDGSLLRGRESAWVVHPFSLWEHSCNDADGIAWGHSVRDGLRPWSTGATYLNFAGGDRVPLGYHDLGSAFEDLARLEDVKTRYDGTDVFHGNHPVPQASAGVP